MRVLGIDPSLRKSGYGLLEVAADSPNAKPRTLTYGAIACPPKMLHSGCLLKIRETVTDLIREHQPDCLAVEGVIFVHSHQIAITLGAARGAAILAAAEAGLPIYEYAPRRVKQSVVGRGAAQKSQVAFMVRALLGLTETPEADAADALAVALTHIQTARLPGKGLAEIDRL